LPRIKKIDILAVGGRDEGGTAAEAAQSHTTQTKW